ncbi:CBS domain-containing protein [Granulicella sp. L46]|jgi:CBS domain-containing protein|uniref:CBS domain-containing protein n=1 Tax=Granulicella sp. L46 TaxID=1641865 RepID=UPI00131D2A31|nr:CBS domain-containing protein [Granulicella sp. L46]
MLRSSIAIGRFMNVDLRVHISFVLLLIISVGFSVVENGGATRGVALWLGMCSAVLVREVARSIAATYVGLRLRALFLLPIGGLMAFSTSSNDATPEANTRLLMLTGPIANFGVGLLLLGTSYGLEPHVSLLAQPWISTSHILRSLVWMQIILGMVSLLPMPVVPAAAKTEPAVEGKPAKSGVASMLPFPSFGLGTGLALAMIVAGFILMSLWMVILGGFMMLGAQLSSAHTVSTTDAETILVREVMLTEYTLLSSSDTLQGALDRSVHSGQDVFPVVRGDRLVGSIARQTIADRLVSDGDSYLQGIMTRSLQLASPTDKLVEALRRAALLGASEFIPVVEDDGADFKMIGILTPQSLSRAVQQIKLMRPTTSKLRENIRD